jgi:hypothetical protein
MGAGYRRVRLSALAGGGAFGSAVGSGAAASNFPSAARSGSRRGAWGNRSSLMARRIAASGDASRGFSTHYRATDYARGLRCDYADAVARFGGLRLAGREGRFDG